jgi:beta-glucosidase
MVTMATHRAAFSPDPYLSSTLSFLTVKGMQSSGLITCAKHYILYEQEPVCTGPLDSDGGRTDCKDVSSEVDGASQKTRQTCASH